MTNIMFYLFQVISYKCIQDEIEIPWIYENCLPKVENEEAQDVADADASSVNRSFHECRSTRADICGCSL